MKREVVHSAGSDGGVDRRARGTSSARRSTVKIGLLATLEGPFAAGGADGMRGAELAVKQRNGMVAAARSRSSRRRPTRSPTWR